jgi:para-nitrobenzyl esterase
MSAAFVAFARTGVPAVEGLAPWRAYDPVTRATMMFGSRIRLVDDPYGDERRALEAIRAKNATPSRA